MILEFFSRFKKEKISQASREAEDVEREFDRLKIEYAKIGSSDLYRLLKEYFEVKIEINRDLLESLNPEKAEEKAKILTVRAEIQVMRTMIQDIDDMKTHYESIVLS